MDEYDVIMKLAEAMRTAASEGDEKKYRLLHATISQEVDSLGLRIPPAERVPSAVIHLNGRINDQYLQALLDS